MTSARTISPTLIDDVVARVVASAAPTRIILFGSAARGDIRPQSDLDVLVVLPTAAGQGEAEERIYRGLWGLGFAVDILTVTEDDLCRHGRNPYLVLHSALAEGREIYRAAG